MLTFQIPLVTPAGAQKGYGMVQAAELCSRRESGRNDPFSGGLYVTHSVRSQATSFDTITEHAGAAAAPAVQCRSILRRHLLQTKP